MRFQERLSYANVVATLALILAATGGGVAYAHHGKITSNEIKKNAVKSKHVKNNNLKSKDIKNGNLRGKDIRNGSLSGADVRNGSLGASDLTAKTRSGVAEAGVRFSSNGSLVSWFNRSGRAPDFIRGNGPGIAHVSFPGTTPPTAAASSP